MKKMTFMRLGVCILLFNTSQFIFGQNKPKSNFDTTYFAPRKIWVQPSTILGISNGNDGGRILAGINLDINFLNKQNQYLTLNLGYNNHLAIFDHPTPYSYDLNFLSGRINSLSKSVLFYSKIGVGISYGTYVKETHYAGGWSFSSYNVLSSYMGINLPAEIGFTIHPIKPVGINIGLKGNLSFGGYQFLGLQTGLVFGNPRKKINTNYK